MKKKTLTLKKIFKKLHLWFGLLSGTVLFIVALTGAIFVFSDDVIAVTESSFMNVKSEQKAQLPPSVLADIALKERQRFLGKKMLKQWDWTALYLSSDPGRSARFSCRHYEKPNQFVDVFINPYSGKIIKTRDTDSYPFWMFISEMHTSLMLGDIGTQIVSYSTLVFFLMMLTGIVLWWPKNRSAAKQRFWFRWKQGLKWKRKNYDLHNILGFYASWITIFMAITGLTMGFDWARNFVENTLGKADTQKKIEVHSAPISAFAVPPHIDEFFAFVKTKNPTADSYHLKFNTKPDAPFQVYAQQNRQKWAPGNEYFFEPKSGKLLREDLYENLPAGAKYDLLTSDIHYGWIFGWPSKIITCIACLIVASLPISGFLIWWGRRKKTKK